MRYRTKSADVLNEADRFQRILDWQLFSMTQDNQLFGYNEEIDWVPGDAIYAHPKTVTRRRGGWMGCSCPLCVDPNEVLEGYYGNWVRPMIQTYEFLDDYDPNAFTGNGYELVKEYPTVRCTKCDVDWEDDQPCWVCWEFDAPIGPQREPRNIKKVLFGIDFDGDMVFSLPAIQYSRADVEMTMQLFSERVEQTFQQAQVYMAGVADTFRGWAAESSFIIYDEHTRMDFDPQMWEAANPPLLWDGIRAVTPYFRIPELSVFEREIPERIVIPSISESAAEPLEENTLDFYPNLGETVWSRSQRTRLKLPRLSAEQLGPQVPTFPVPVPAPRGVPNVQYSPGWVETPITERRRPRR